MILAALLLAAAAPPPELPVQVYQARRERLMTELKGCIGVLAAHGETNGVTESFRQDGNFLWLTGVNEDHAWILFTPRLKHDKTTIFLRPRNVETERWTGPRDALSPALKDKLGVDHVRRGDPEYAMLSAAAHHDCVSILAPAAPGADDRDDAKLAQRVASRLGLKLVYQRGLLAQLRSAHGPEELERMERAIAITRAGHEAAARTIAAGVTEREVQTQLEFAFLKSGATGLSYSSIVGSGPNGAVLHWDQNNRVMKPGDLVVVDAAAEYGRYAADVTRTFPVNGKFNDEQAKVYRAVYQAQEDVFAILKPGVTYGDLQKAAEDSFRKSGYLDYFIHGLGHFVGLDVHDAGDYEAPLPVGAVVTIEPGAYLPERGFGVRIEDEVLITDKGFRLLTADFPRKLEDVEAWVARAKK